MSNKQLDIFESFKEGILNLDVVKWCESNLTLDGAPFRLHGNGYKPLAEIYRYAGIKALERDAKPLVLVKGRQIGGTVLACALEMYFMASGLFGTGKRPPMRIMHAFPSLIHSYSFAKTKLNPMITSAKLSDKKIGGKTKSVVQIKLDQNSDSNDSLQFKQFENGNHIWIESTGANGDRLRNRTIDYMIFDECFPYNQCIETESGKQSIGSICDMFSAGENLPRVKTYNENKKIFEYKEITNVWNRGEKQLIKLICNNREIKCTPNHKFLTMSGWKEAAQLQFGELILTTHDGVGQVSKSLNDDQFQVILGSFLGEGHIISHGKSKYRIRERHGLAQKEYCTWKAELFNSKIDYIERNGCSQKPAYAFCSKLFGLEENFPETKTTCPQWVLDKLDVRGLAIWFMDDGSRNIAKNTAVINTCYFDEDSQKRIVEKLKFMGIECHYAFYKAKNKEKGYFQIYLNKCGYLTLCNIIRPYIHSDLFYKVVDASEKSATYIWNKLFNNYGLIPVKSIEHLDQKECVYDIEVKDNHNFIITSSRRSKNLGGLIAHNCQDIPREAIGAATKILTKAKYGPISDGVQFYLGTPKRKSSEYYKIWQMSSRQYYYLGCENCDKHFPLYTPGSNEWEKIWLYGFIVKCTHCGHEQDKREAAERGKWIASNPDEDCKFVGYHINMLFNPEFTKEKIIEAKPENHPTNTERLYQNEVLGEFFAGDAGIISIEEISEKCADINRTFRANIPSSEKKKVYLGVDWGGLDDPEQRAEGAASQGQSYSCVVVLTAETKDRFTIDFAERLKKNDPESKRGIIEQMFRQYSIVQAVGDIGFANDLTHDLQRIYGDRFLASQPHAKLNNKIKFNDDVFPKYIGFEKDFYYAELLQLLKKGAIRFPYGSYERVQWLVAHCCSMEIKTTLNRSGEPIQRYVKGSTQNDGFCSLLNAYLAYKYDTTNGFKDDPMNIIDSGKKNKIPCIVGHIPRMR